MGFESYAIQILKENRWLNSSLRRNLVSFHQSRLFTAKRTTNHPHLSIDKTREANRKKVKKSPFYMCFAMAICLFSFYMIFNFATTLVKYINMNSRTNLEIGLGNSKKVDYHQLVQAGDMAYDLETISSASIFYLLTKGIFYVGKAVKLG